MYLAKRLGFVKLALQHSAALVPCYAFGVVDLYGVSPAQVMVRWSMQHDDGTKPTDTKFSEMSGKDKAWLEKV